MKKLLARKKSKKQTSGAVSRFSKKTTRKVASKSSRKGSSLKKAIPLAKKDKPRKSKVVKAASRSSRSAVGKSRKTALAAEKAAVKTAPPTPVAAPARLLHQTKTTSPALALLGKGVELIHKKDFKKAKHELQTLLQLYPAELDILARARSYIQICEREELNLKKPAVTSDQFYALGILEHNKSNYDAAISYFLQSLAKHPGADYIYYSIAAAHAKKGDVDKAIENLRKAVELNEDSRIYAKNDADFASIQTAHEFAELIGINQPTHADSK